MGFFPPYEMSKHCLEAPRPRVPGFVSGLAERGMCPEPQPHRKTVWLLADGHFRVFPSASTLANGERERPLGTPHAYTKHGAWRQFARGSVSQA